MKKPTGPQLDLVGKVFGQLTVIEFLGLDKWRNTLFKAECSCGNLWEGPGTCLVRGGTKSCGCLRKNQPSRRNNCIKGAISELAFGVHANRNGLAVGFPHGHDHKFDLICFKGSTYYSVQVKSTTQRVGPSYIAGIKRNKKPYDVDFYAVHVVPEDIFYVIPTKALPNVSTIRLSSTYEKYKEAWHLFKEKKSCK